MASPECFALSEFDLRSLLEALNTHGVEFVVIGGVAVAAHGSARGVEARLDIVPDPDPDNLKRLTEALGKLESTLPTVGDRPFDPESDSGVVSRGGNVTAMTVYIPVRVCSLARLREMKQAQSRTQDLLDLENLPDD